MANYRVLVHYDPERSLFVARAPELEHCSAEGSTRGEAIQKVEEEIQAQVANMRERGKHPPAALDDDAAVSGQLSAKVSRTLHRDLAWQARLEGVEVDQLVGEILAQGLDARRQRRRPPGPNQNVQPDRNDARSDAPDRGNNRDDRRDDRRGNDRGGRGGQGQQGRYHAIMDDRATFLEYVRGLEQGQQGRGSRPGGGGPGPGPGGGGGPGGGRRRGGFRNDRGGGGEGGTPPAGDEGGGGGAGGGAGA